MSNSCHFDGSSGYITCPDSSAFRTPSTSLFLGCWFLFNDSSPAAGEVFIAKLASGGSVASYQIYQQSGGTTLGANAGSANITTSTSLSTGAWYFVAFSWVSGTSITISVYDHTLTQVATHTAGSGGGSIPYDTEIFSVGAYSTGANFFHGDIGSVVLTATASGGSSDDINYAKMVPANFPASPVFDSGYCSPSNLTDLSGNGATFTVNGTVTTGSTPPYTLCGGSTFVDTRMLLMGVGP